MPEVPDVLLLAASFYKQSNIVNSKSSGLEVLFRIISSSNYREVEIKQIFNPKK